MWSISRPRAIAPDVVASGSIRASRHTAYRPAISANSRASGSRFLVWPGRRQRSTSHTTKLTDAAVAA